MALTQQSNWSTGGTFSYTLSVANLPSHAHPITDVAHSHTAYQSGHSHNLIIGSHSHTFAEWSTNSSGTGVACSFRCVLTIRQTYQTANTSTVALGGNTDTQTPPVGVNANGTGLSTTQNTGSGAAMSIIPSYVALNFIIRFRLMSTQFRPLEIPPGVVAKATKQQRSTNWAEVNLMRWVENQMAPVGGQSQFEFHIRQPVQEDSLMV